MTYRWRYSTRDAGATSPSPIEWEREGARVLVHREHERFTHLNAADSSQIMVFERVRLNRTFPRRPRSFRRPARLEPKIRNQPAEPREILKVDRLDQIRIRSQPVR